MIAACCVVVANSGTAPRAAGRRLPEGPGLRWERVVRGDLESVVTTGGDVCGEKFTEISCEVENVAGAPLTILRLVPNGSNVTKDQPLCWLDSSAFEEQLRLQEIEVERARSERLQARLDLDAAEAALRDYRDGQAPLMEKDYRTQLGLARSDAARARDRENWSEGMLKVRYLSPAEAANENTARIRAELNVDKLAGALDTFRKYTRPKTLLDLSGKIEGAREKFVAAEVAASNAESRLEKLKKQIDRCTIRAPHDGLLVYEDFGWGDENALREGLQIFQGRPLFALPDLTRLTVRVSVHESMVERVRVGMPAKVVVDALGRQELPGRVKAISQMPENNWRVGLDNQHFLADVQLDGRPEGLRPGQSATVRIVHQRREGVLTVPVEAVAYQDGQPYCEVADDEGPARRPVRLGLASRDRLEVLEGLEEGDEVLVRRYHVAPSEAQALQATANLPFLP